MRYLESSTGGWLKMQILLIVEVLWVTVKAGWDLIFISSIFQNLYTIRTVSTFHTVVGMKL